MLPVLVVLSFCFSDTATTEIYTYFHSLSLPASLPILDLSGLVVVARQVAGAHEEFADDLAAHELEGLAEQLHPLVLAERMVRVDPAAEGAVVAAQGDDALCILDGGVDLQAVADDAGEIGRAHV